MHNTIQLIVDKMHTCYMITCWSMYLHCKPMWETELNVTWEHCFTRNDANLLYSYFFSQMPIMDNLVPYLHFETKLFVISSYCQSIHLKGWLGPVWVTSRFWINGGRLGPMWETSPFWINGGQLVSMVVSWLELYPGLTIQSRPCRP